VPSPSDPSDRGGLRSAGALSAVGLTLVFAVVIGAFIGYWIDRWLGTSPWGFLAGFFIGMAAGIRSVFQTVAAVSRDERRDG
jgi:ATP synthase protein I